MFENILVMTDFSPDADFAVSTAVNLAKTYKTKLTILHVIHDESNLPFYLSSLQFEELNKAIKDEVERKFEELKEKIKLLNTIPFETKIRRGSSYAQGVMEMEEETYDLVVVGSHGQSALRKFFYGSTSEKIIRRAPISVLVTKMPD
jgi:nucleotide-binding universal stress UspA family protein